MRAGFGERFAKQASRVDNVWGGIGMVLEDSVEG